MANKLHSLLLLFNCLSWKTPEHHHVLTDPEGHGQGNLTLIIFIRGIPGHLRQKTKESLSPELMPVHGFEEFSARIFFRG